MDRRNFLIWAIYALNGLFAVVLGVPALIYLLDPRNRRGAETKFITVTKLGELPMNQWTEAVVRATRRDAWTLTPDDILGRVWLIKRGDREVECLNTTCPHLGCGVNFTGIDFLCPCHGARFDTRGWRIQPGNPSTHGMFKPAVKLEDVAGETLVQITFPGKATDNPNEPQGEKA